MATRQILINNQKIILLNFVKNKCGKIINIDDYKNNSTKLTYECELNHQWQASWSNVQNGKWCPTCSKNKKLSIIDAQEVAILRNAKCISTEYNNNRTKLTWQCNMGHVFNMHLNAIRQRGNWCPYCSSWTSEEICRLYFEAIFNQRFEKIRPDWLLNSNGNRMELDGYGASLVNNFYIAFEHQGEQHYKIIPSRNNEESLIQRKSDDMLKLKLCNERNIILIQIPHLFKMLKLDNLIEYIKTQCSALINIDDINFDIKIDFNDLYMSKTKLLNTKLIIESKGGTLLSTEFVNATSKLDVECSFKHKFKMSRNAIKNGNWCPICNKNAKLTIEEMKQLAIINNGTCVSDNYINSITKLEWHCNICNKNWFAAPYSIKNMKTWCPHCAHINKKN